MKTLSRFTIFTLILTQLLIAGCAKQPSLPQIGAFKEVYGAPHIVQDNVCYLIGPWCPGAIVLKLYYKGSNEKGDSDLQGLYAHHDLYYQRVTKIEWEYIDEKDLPVYIPLLIESLKDTTQGGKGGHAYARLHDIITMEFPDGYGDYYMHPTKDGFTGTPFVRDKFNRIPEFDETTYNKVIQWWNTELHEYYDRE